MKKEGTLFLEIGYDQSDDIRQLIEAVGRYEDNVSVIKDLAGHDRIVAAHIKGK